MPENPRVPKISQFGEKNFFREAYPPLMLKNAYFSNNSKIIIPFLKPLFKSCYSDPILGPYGAFLTVVGESIFSLHEGGVQYALNHCSF